MNLFKKFFNPVQTPLTYDTLSSETLAHHTTPPQPLRFTLTRSFPNMSISSHTTLASPKTFQYSSLFATQSSLLSVSVDNQKNTQLQFSKQFRNIITKFHALVSTDTFASVEIDMRNKTNSLSFKNVHPAIKNVKDLYVFNFLQNVNQNLSVGWELICDKKKMNGAVGVRVEDSRNVAVLMMQEKSIFNFSYVRKFNDILSFMVESGFDGRDINGRVGARICSKRAEVRVGFESDGKSRINLEEKISDGFKIGFDGEFDHLNNKFKYGLGFSIDS
ncbi:translocase of outer mitochondrial membrane [Conglomerata obtusa]